MFTLFNKNGYLLILFFIWCIQFFDCITLFDNSKSYAVYDKWNITTVGKLVLNFKTQSQYSLLLYVDDKSEDGLENAENNSEGNYLEISLNKGQVEVIKQTVKLSGEIHKQVLSLGENVNNLEWHTLTVTKYIGTLQVSVDNNVALLDFSSNDDKFQINSYLYIGGLSEEKTKSSFGFAKLKPRFVGCIESLQYSSGNTYLKPAQTFLKSERIAPNCLDSCSLNTCANKGKCINLFTRAACDCFGTGFTGEICNNYADTISQDDDDYLIWNVNDLYATAVYLRFRYKIANPNGILFYTKRKGILLLVEVVDGKLRVAGGSTTTVPSEVIHQLDVMDSQWHSVDITKKGNVVTVVLDSIYKSNFTIKATSVIDSFDQEPVYFGGVPFPKYIYGVNSMKNFVGCLQQIEFNKDDVIYKVLHTINKNIEKVGHVRIGCSYNKSNIVIAKTTTQSTTTTTKRNEINDNNFATGSNNIKIIEVNERIIEKFHTKETSVSQSVIVWITAAIVIGTIIILISAACVVHHIRMRYTHRSRSARSLADLENEHELIKKKTVFVKSDSTKDDVNKKNMEEEKHFISRDTN
ncbi:axotactin isoform X1 [Hydra vulgaris]|uniref:axotactin isoform X1 n=1 Tax=Hydra vulgaris TaxID=6087 RepID=UPI001F5E9690|nr:neurexin-3b [Hydra vulgaris]